MNRLVLSLIGCSIATMITVHAQAATTLRVATWLPPVHSQNSEVLPTWAKWVNEATEGRVNVVIENHTGHPKTIFSAVEDGVVDAGWTVNAYVPGRFSLTGMAEIPGGMNNAEEASVALWKVQQQYFNEANEYEGLHLLAQWVHAPGVMHTTFPVDNISDLKDKKIRLGGGMINILAERLGVTPVSASAPKSYELLQQKVVDGTFLPTGESKFFKLSEVTSHMTVFPTALYTTVFSFIANPEFMESLSQEDRDAIMSVSGEKLSRLEGKVWQDMHPMGLEHAKSNGMTVVELDADDARVKDIGKLTADMDQTWIDSVKDRGVDAAAALAEFRKLQGM